MFFGCHILVKNRLVTLVWLLFSCHLLPRIGLIFFQRFEISCFVCIVLLFDDISLIFLLLPVLSSLFPQVVLLFFLTLPFPFCLPMFKRLYFVLSLWLILVDFFISVFSRISHPGFDIFFVFFKGIPIFSQINYYYYYYYLLLESFSGQCILMVFHWSLSDSKSPQVSRTLLSILTVLNNAVVWLVSTRLRTFMSSRHLIVL